MLVCGAPISAPLSPRPLRLPPLPTLENLEARISRLERLLSVLPEQGQLAADPDEKSLRVEAAALRARVTHLVRGLEFKAAQVKDLQEQLFRLTQTTR